MLWFSSLHCCGFCKLRAASMCGQLSITCLLRHSYFYSAVEVFQAPENQSKDQHYRALSRGGLGTSSLLVLLHYLWHFPSGSLSSLAFIVEKLLEESLCFAQKVFISRKLQVSTLEDCWGLAAHAQCSYIPDSFILHACTEVAFYCQF